MNAARGLTILHDEIISCRKCPRLVRYREEIARVKRRAFRDCEYWGRPVPGFGDPKARLFIVGLAPAAHGGNRTGRVFTGDRSGDFLFAALYRAGFASQPQSTHLGDGLRLRDAYIAAAVRCAPPANKPLPEEIRNCRVFLLRELKLLRPRAVLVLGKIAFDAYRALLREQGEQVRNNAFRFAHGASYAMPDAWPHLFCAYHPSQQNTLTGRLTPAKYERVLKQVRRFLGAH
jgi:uracil-DNA glycosylase family 4